ncbi:hypothetical protein PCO31111_02161 [Pandoraea communis]|uniref:Uncharacterized protein n=1 Tax=Pandoraea communis TaxID=2508297 RepID=A0A5E4UMS6_9BURK|nr:hypothetical protein [Pandoraea communis]VVE01236.1 hypothetical protein PCO31111_02161 [Pandoraea communis]
MARSALKFDDATYAALLAAARDADAAHPHDNPAFLDAFFVEAWKVTHRIYGAQTYLRFIAQAGVTRRPSASTVQKAIVRARAVYEVPAVPSLGSLLSAGQSAWVQKLEQNLASALTLFHTIPGAHNPATDAVIDAADAMRRVQDLERENLELRARLAQMTVAAAYAREALTVFAPQAIQQVVGAQGHQGV